MSIRRLNYTKRMKLTHDHVRIRLSPSVVGQPRGFEVDLALPKLSPTGRVYVEAYRTSPAARMRFDFGTVEKPISPAAAALLLTEFADDIAPLFRVKIVDAADQNGKLLAEAHQLKALDPDEISSPKSGILRTAWRDNGGLVWDVDLNDEGGPILYIDQTADPHRDLPRRIEFRALVYPEIIRKVLTEIIVNEPGSIEDTERWHYKWIRFPRDTFGFAEALPAPDDDEGRIDWIDAAVRHCSRKADFVRAMTPTEVDEQ